MQKSDNGPLGRLNWSDVAYFLEVARNGRLGEAARRLGVDYTTVSRRIKALEEALGTLLFDKSRVTGFTLTAEGQRLLPHAEAMETTVETAREQLGGEAQAPRGHVRIGTTEGFGVYFLSPRLPAFAAQFPEITVDLLAVPRFVSLYKREADIAVTLEQPSRGPYLISKLSDYRLRLYASRRYLEARAPIATLDDLPGHRFVSYVEELVYSSELLYLEPYVRDPQLAMRSTSIAAQLQAVRAGIGIGILPCFMAAQEPELQAVLPEAVTVTRSFWLSCHEDLRKVRRIAVLWDYLRRIAGEGQAVLMEGGGNG